MPNKSTENKYEQIESPALNEDVTSVSQSRRKFAKTALIVPPVLTTLANKPAWGNQMVCFSGFQSGNLSGNFAVECRDAKSPGYYKTSPLLSRDGLGWPENTPHCDPISHGIPPDSIRSDGTGKMRSGYDLKKNFQDGGTPFRKLFPGAHGAGGNTTLLQTLHASTGSFESYAIAVLFNARNYSDYVFTYSDAYKIITSILNTGTYQHTNGITWTKAEMMCVFDQSWHFNETPDDIHVAGCADPKFY